jgi:hypothetical protein
MVYKTYGLANIKFFKIDKCLEKLLCNLCPHKSTVILSLWQFCVAGCLSVDRSVYRNLNSCCRFQNSDLCGIRLCTVVTICTASLTFNNSTFCPHSVFMCFVWIWELIAIISLYSINWLVCITEGMCLLRGTDWVRILGLFFQHFSAGLTVWFT